MEHFDKLDSCGIPYTDPHKLFIRKAIFEFQIICVEDEKFKDSETKTSNEKENPISASESSNLIQEPIFICDPNPRDLVSSFINALVNLATRSKAQMRMNFFKVNRKKSRLARVLKTLNQCRSHCVGFDGEDDNSENSSTVSTNAEKSTH